MTRPHPEDDRTLAERALGHAGAGAQVTVTREHSLLLRFARSAPTQATAVRDAAVEIAVLVDGHVGVAATGALHDDGLRDAARRARTAATALAAAGPGAYPGLPGPAALPQHAGWDAETAVLDPAPGGRALADAFSGCAAHDAQAFGVWTAGEVRRTIASTTGVLVQDAVTDGYMKVMARREDGRTGLGTATGVAAGTLDGAALAEQACALLGEGAPASLAPGAYPVVLGPDAVAALLSFLGHLAFDGMAHAEGRGALVGRIGDAVAAGAVTLRDDPLSPHTLPRAFDAEGVPARPLTLIADGTAVAVCHDTRSAADTGAGARSTGHAQAVGGGGEYGGPVPANLVLDGGDAAGVDALCAPIERGLYVHRLWYVNVVHPARTLLTGMTRDGTFLIEDGRRTRPLDDVRVTDEVLRILGATEALTTARRLVSEGEFYGRRHATGVVAPALRAGGLRISGGA